jgi:tRNA(Leu) C34 or U34 (ribose-2'-O)-methylase TrmL
MDRAMSSEETVIIGLYNPKSPTNVGAVMRAAGCYQATEVRYNGERYDRAVKFQTDTKNAKDKIALTAMDNLIENLDDDVEIVCVELALGASALPSFQHPKKAIYLFGPEDSSLPQPLVNAADHVVYVPTVGCMNLAASVNVTLYDRMAKGQLNMDDNQRILASRDTKNRLKVDR